MRMLKAKSFWLLAVAVRPFGGVHRWAARSPAGRQGDRGDGVRRRAVIVGDGTTTIENGAIVVQGNRITAVGRAGEVQVPAGATHVDLKGRTVMPALVDLHSHLGYENTAKNDEDESNFTRENLIDHLERFAYTGHALTHSLGNDNPEVFDVRYAADLRGSWTCASNLSRIRSAVRATTPSAAAWPGKGREIREAARRTNLQAASGTSRRT